jgi:hypothetical protein
MLVRDHTISPVIPASRGTSRIHAGSGPEHRRRSLPVGRLAPEPADGLVYGLARLDCHGRIADRGITDALGWGPGTRLDIREAHGVLRLAATDDGVFRVTAQGHLRLPSTVRSWCRLSAGTRVMLAADPATGVLAIYPPAAIDAMVTAFTASTGGGERR